MNSITVALGGLVTLLLGYFLCGRFIEHRIVKSDDTGSIPVWGEG
jgi:hypothetical protein